MKLVIGLGSIMFIDRQGQERFAPIINDEETGLQYVDTEEINWVELDMVGEETTPEGNTLNEYWSNIRKVVSQ